MLVHQFTLDLFKLQSNPANNCVKWHESSDWRLYTSEGAAVVDDDVHNDDDIDVAVMELNNVIVCNKGSLFYIFLFYGLAPVLKIFIKFSLQISIMDLGMFSLIAILQTRADIRYN
uniref:Uncharacterized protein n=1 Tax=Glossina pallidipes TaxID=7398 RepID=A0A1B0ACB5_GLOPL